MRNRNPWYGLAPMMLVGQSFIVCALFICSDGQRSAVSTNQRRTIVDGEDDSDGNGDGGGGGGSRKANGRD